MAKRKKLNRLAGITIPDELKRRAVCECCNKAIHGDHTDPVISAPSLGKGNYHFECAIAVWEELKKLDKKRRKEEDNE
jgi:hypothetical protein